MLASSPAVSRQDTPDLEIDRPAEFAPYLLKNRQEIAFYIERMMKQHCPATAFIEEGPEFFSTTIRQVDHLRQSLAFDPPADEMLPAATLATRGITLIAYLDQIKIQFRLKPVRELQQSECRLLFSPLPDTLLRLQRREHFRIVPPGNAPLSCRIGTHASLEHGRALRVADVSFGGLGLEVPATLADQFPPGTLLPDCRLEIPGEGVLNLHLMVHTQGASPSPDDAAWVHLGCEFFKLPMGRLAMIERYVTRVARHKKARESGLID